MRLKVVVIDFEIPRPIKRVGLALATGGLVVLAASGVLAAVGHNPPAVSHTWQDGDVLTAADLNGAFSEIDTRVTTLEGASKPAVITEWQAYTPKVQFGTTDVGSGIQTTSAFWRRVGDSMEVGLVTTIASCPAGGAVRYYLPNNANIAQAKLNQFEAIGAGIVYGPGTNNIVRTVAVTNVSSSIPGAVSVDANGDPGGGVVCTVAGVGGQIRIRFTVPVDGWTTNSP